MAPGGVDDARDVGSDGPELAVLQASNVQDHVDLGRSIGNRQRCLVCLGIHVRCPEWKAHHRRDAHVRPGQHLARDGDTVRVQTDGGAMIPARDLTGHQDVVLRGRRVEQGVVDPRG